MPVIRETEMTTAPVTVIVSSKNASAEWSEQELITQAKSRSEAAFEQLFERYASSVFRLAQNVTRNHEDAEDVVQNAFAKAFEKLPEFRGESRFYTWLVRITINEALTNLRQRRSNQVSIDESKELDDGSVPVEIEDWRPNPEQLYSQRELQRILATSINELGPRYLPVFQMRHVLGLSTEETAQALAVPSTTVKARLRRARLALQNSLEEYSRSISAVGNHDHSAEGHSEALS